MKSAEKFIQDIAREAGDAVLKRFGKEGVHRTKSAHLWDVVTKADLFAERLIASRIRRKYPAHGILGEEGSSFHTDAEYVWVIDPIDGTANFAVGIPLFGVMVALKRKEKVLLSACYIPVSKELFFAKAGGGAFLNGKRIRCSPTTKLSRSFGMSSSSLWLRTTRFMNRLLAMADKDHMMLGAFGSICVNACYVACGRRDWFVQLVGSPWDFAPVSLILREAGCRVTDVKGKAWTPAVNEMVAANPHLHRELLKLTRNI